MKPDGMVVCHEFVGMKEPYPTHYDRCVNSIPRKVGAMPALIVCWRPRSEHWTYGGRVAITFRRMG